MKASSRYSTYDSRSSSDPSSSSEFNHKPSSRALVNTKPTTKADPTLTTMVKKLLMEKKPKSIGAKLIIPSDFIAQDLKKDAKRVTAFSSLQKKLFGNGNNEEKKKKKKALTEVKPNTRTLAMVLRSERDLLAINKDQESEISQLKSMLEEKNQQVIVVYCLCLTQ